MKSEHINTLVFEDDDHRDAWTNQSHGADLGRYGISESLEYNDLQKDELYLDDNGTSVSALGLTGNFTIKQDVTVYYAGYPNGNTEAFEGTASHLWVGTYEGTEVTGTYEHEDNGALIAPFSGPVIDAKPQIAFNFHEYGGAIQNGNTSQSDYINGGDNGMVIEQNIDADAALLDYAYTKLIGSARDFSVPDDVRLEFNLNDSTIDWQQGQGDILGTFLNIFDLTA